MEKIASKFPQLSNVFQKYKLEIIRKGNPIPLDYIMCLPKRVDKRLNKFVREQIIKDRKEELGVLMTDRRALALRQGIDLRPEDEKDLVKA
eukprot:CAMPEP_0176357006 /NCGR_PEP_ID=MMETSP0126-20121128/14449_1 /TAXON_ID=141414 ORGANISM="Strombidinopsis acuminatum, Strain SPMC142" /NCGR_SAMPLE_ID=MMETSP0126 /ASSEMBLY_ACC=CAM_ASM_000229 /LENGTH=90 /DNA_ID=CAMNT_0017710397 /DNA_START=2519 /DNA_END=2791 /DNA_ORIENTATION=+